MLRTAPLAAMLLLMPPAHAQGRSSWEICREISDPGAFAACSDVIAGGEYFGQTLAIAYGNRALLYLARNDGQHALADATEAVKINDKVAMFRATRAMAFWTLGQDEGAAKEAEEAIWLDTGAPLPYMIRGRVEAKRKQFQAAVDDFTHVLQLTPGDAEAYCQRGAVYLQMQQWQKGLDDETAALQRKPDFALAFFMRALAKRALGDTAGSDADFEAANKINPALKKPSL